jgi:hypothetical protein
MGATGWAARGNPSIEKITAPSEDDVLRVSTRYTEETASATTSNTVLQRWQRDSFLPSRFSPHQDLFSWGYWLHQVKIQEETVW